MAIGRIISGSLPIPLLMGRVWFNYNRVISMFGFIFSNPRPVRGEFRYCYSHFALIIFLKYFFYYFILYFNINNNNNCL